MSSESKSEGRGRGLRQRLLSVEPESPSSLKSTAVMHATSQRSKYSLVAKFVAVIIAFTIAAGIGIWQDWRTATDEKTGKQISPLRQLVRVISEAVASPALLFAGRDRVNIILIGTDVNRDRRGRILPTQARADTIIIMSLSRSEGKAYLLSIPRDTAVIIDRHGLSKINAAHVYGGPEGLIKVLRDQLCINVEYYVRTSFEGFIKIVDAIGGVELYVEKDMHYDDNWGNLHIHLKRGWQMLDGDKAHQYVRFRHDREGDIGRTRRQRKFLQAVAKKLMSPSMLPRLPKLIRTTYQYVETNMSLKQLLSLAAFAERLDSERIETATLPGRPVANFWLPNRNEARELLVRMLGETFGQYSWDIQLAAIENRVRARLVKRRAKEKATPAEGEQASSEPEVEMSIVPMVTELPSDWLLQSTSATDLPTVASSNNATNPNLEPSLILHPPNTTSSGSLTSGAMQSAPTREQPHGGIAPVMSPEDESSAPKPAEPHEEETEDAQTR